MMVVIGVGSPVLCDDRAGHRVIEILDGMVPSGTRLVKTCGTPLALLEEPPAAIVL